MTEWQPIETAPKDGTFIIGRRGYDIHITSWAKTSHVPLYGWCWCLEDDVENFDLWEPTHWIPDDDPPPLKCPRCNGTGCVDTPYSDSDPSCPECDGEGVIE